MPRYRGWQWISALLLSQARTFDGEGVAAFAESTQQGLREGSIAKEVLPRRIGHVGCNQRGPAVVTFLHELEENVRLLGDEMYPNGIFEFNITRLLAFVQEHADRFLVERVELSEFRDYGKSPHLNEETVRLADLSRPILLAEMAPGRYSVIDGNHRLAKARRQGAAVLPPTDFNALRTYQGHRSRIA